MKNIVKRLVTAFILVPLTLFAATNKHFDTIVSFGDSLSDNGNLYAYFLHFLPVSPPYFEGHFSNGKLWNEHVYDSYFPEDYKVGFQDYAVGGAGAVLSYKENLPFTLTAELNDYLYWNKYGRRDTTLYIVWIGANNYLNGPTNVEDLTTRVVDAIDTVVKRIINAGGNKILIANLPDVGRAPQATEAGNSELLTQLTQLHNQKLDAVYTELKRNYPEVRFAFFDVAKFFNDVITNPGAHGITNTDEACYMGSYSGWLVKNGYAYPSQQQLATYLDEMVKSKPLALNAKTKEQILANPQLRASLRAAYSIDKLNKAGLKTQEEPLDCSGYLFWDHVHPSAGIHQALAIEARKVLDKAGFIAVVPEDL